MAGAEAHAAGHGHRAGHRSNVPEFRWVLSVLKVLTESLEKKKIFNKQKTTLLLTFAQPHSHFNTMNAKKNLGIRRHVYPRIS